jgi:hypothetical protein
MRLLLLPLVALTGCGHYADFTLPKLLGGDPRLTYTFEQRLEPVLPHGAMHDVLKPSVVAGALYYSAFDGHTWRTAQNSDVLLSPDPQTWEGSYIAANGFALQVNQQVWYWYVGGPKGAARIGLARDWKKEPQPVLDHGPYMSWDEMAVADPYVVRIDPYFYLYYLGEDRAHRQRLGVARSTDGIHFEKSRTNPILELGDIGAFDENGLGEPAVWSAEGFYWMLYTGRDASENRRLGLARSTDGVHWPKLPTVFSGAYGWNSKVLCDPFIDGDAVYFGGGDVARPDENLNGQIGYGTLKLIRP